MLTFRANNLQEAMSEVKQRLGPSATIVSWKNLGTGIEVTATSKDGSADAVEGGRDGFAQKGTSPRYDVFEHEEKIAQREKTARENALKTSAEKLKSNLPQKPKSSGLEIIAKPKVTKEKIAKSSLHPLIPILARTGLSLKEIKPFAKYFDEKGSKETLIEILQSEFKFKPIEAAPENAIAIIGPSGAGKTATAAKLAARALSAECDVLLISTDTERQGGVEQLKMLAKKLSAAFNFADNANEARNLTKNALDAGKCVIIDCAATSVIEPASVRVLQGLIYETQAEPIICAPADLRADDLNEMFEAYKSLGANRAIITRLDLTRRRAGFLGALFGKEISLSQISASPFIAGGLAPASAKRLASMIIDE